MKRTALALTLILALLISALAGATFVDLAEANWLFPMNSSPPSKPEISVLLPESDKKYSTNIGVDFRVRGPNWGQYGGYIKLSLVSYSLDDKANVTFVGDQIALGDTQNLVIHFSGNLSGLSNGAHSLVIYVQSEGQYSPEPYKWVNFTVVSSSARKFFAVDASIEDNVLPEISILSLTNGVYMRSDITLDFTLSETCSQIRYSLDGQSNVMIDGKTTLTGLPDGTHNVAIYASDLAGNTKSSVTCFTVAVPPKISITLVENDFSSENKYLGAVDVMLNFTINEPTSWISYSLDGQGNCTTGGNTTIGALTYRPHNITVYASDVNGNIGASKTVAFNTDKSESLLPEPVLFTAMLIIIYATVSAFIGIGLLLYRKKHGGFIRVAVGFGIILSVMIAVAGTSVISVAPTKPQVTVSGTAMLGPHFVEKITFTNVRENKTYETDVNGGKYYSISLPNRDSYKVRIVGKVIEGPSEYIGTYTKSSVPLYLNLYTDKASVTKNWDGYAG